MASATDISVRLQSVAVGPSSLCCDASVEQYLRGLTYFTVDDFLDTQVLIEGHVTEALEDG